MKKLGYVLMAVGIFGPIMMAESDTATFVIGSLICFGLAAIGIKIDRQTK